VLSFFIKSPFIRLLATSSRIRTPHPHHPPHSSQVRYILCYPLRRSKLVFTADAISVWASTYRTLYVSGSGSTRSAYCEACQQCLSAIKGDLWKASLIMIGGGYQEVELSKRVNHNGDILERGSAILLRDLLGAMSYSTSSRGRPRD